MKKDNIIPGYIRNIFESNPNTGRKTLSKLAGISEQEARFFCKLWKDNSKTCIRRGVAVGDLHYPVDNHKCKKILFDFLEDFQPDIFILAGDQMDMGCISAFNRSKLKLLENKRLSYEYRGFQRSYMDRFEDVLKSDCDRYWMYGNHEDRVTRLIENFPQYEGFIEVNKNLDLSGWVEIPFNGVLSLGEMNFIHGHWHNKYHADKNVSVYGKQVFNWHVHTNQVFTMHSPINGLPKQGVSVGCMCDRNPEWLRDKPNSWVNQFMFFYLFGDGSFSYFTPLIVNGRSMIDGRLYEG